jgi:hypothetical protein
MLGRHQARFGWHEAHFLFQSFLTQEGRKIRFGCGLIGHSLMQGEFGGTPLFFHGPRLRSICRDIKIFPACWVIRSLASWCGSRFAFALVAVRVLQCIAAFSPGILHRIVLLPLNFAAQYG